MNKRGGLDLFTFFIVIIVCTTAIVLTHNTDSKFTPLDWNKFFPIIAERLNVSDPINYSSVSSVVYHMAYKIVDVGGYIIFSVTNTLTLWSIEHPEINWKLIMIVFIISVLAPIVIALIKLLIIIYLFIKDFIQSRKEKNEIKRLKANRGKRENETIKK